MLFNSVTYAVFFPAVFLISWLLAPWRRIRLGFILVASYVFYAGWTVSPAADWVTAYPALADLFASLGIEVDMTRASGEVGPGDGWQVVLSSIKYVPLLFVATSIDYYLGVFLDRIDDARRRKLMLIGTIVLNVGILIFFKYWNWGADTFSWLLSLVGIAVGDIYLRVELPIGISFFCFMSLSYVIDVYRRDIPACKSYLDYLTYISFFPHLVAGPIIRGRDLLPHLERPTQLTAKTGGEGLFLIAAGLFKKIVIGDYIAVNFVDRVFAEPSSYSSVEAMAAMYGYAVQVYCDFAGYSDVAIGSALLLGYRFKLNFDAPFKSTNIVEFWRRWHISLSTWLRDYIYIALGGSRKGKFRQYINMSLTMVICGVWHGAAWTYFWFGCIQGLALSVTHWFSGIKQGVRVRVLSDAHPYRQAEGEEQKAAARVERPIGKPLAIAAVVSVALRLLGMALASYLKRPGVAVLIDGLIVGAWVVATVTLGCQWVGAKAEKNESLATFVNVAQRLLGIVVLAVFLLVLVFVANAFVEDRGRRFILPVEVLYGVAVIGAGYFGWKHVKIAFGSVFAIIANFTFVGLTFTMFRAASLDKAWAMYERLLTGTTYTPNLHRNVLFIILLALCLQWAPRSLYDRARELFIRAPAVVQAVVLFLVALALREAQTAEAVPFVYFQF